MHGGRRTKRTCSVGCTKGCDAKRVGASSRGGTDLVAVGADADVRREGETLVRTYGKVMYDNGSNFRSTVLSGQ